MLLKDSYTLDAFALVKDAINPIEYIPNYTESSSLIDDDMTLTDVLEKAENIQKSLDEQQLSLFSIEDEEKITNDNYSLTLVDSQEEKCEKRFHILSRLTPSEIAQFHAVSQMQKPYQLKQAQVIIEELKNEMIHSHDSDGEELFLQADTFFKESTLDTRIIKLIQRYSGLAAQAQLFLQHLKAGSEQYGEPPVNSQVQTAIVELEKLFFSIEKRLQQLATGKLVGKEEIEMLIEIEDFREQLAVLEQIINTYR